MTNHTYCRAKALGQKRCTAAEALAIVKDFLDSDSALLADDVRANLYNVSRQLEVLKEFPEILGDDVDEAANAQKPAATAPGAELPAPGPARSGKKKDHDKAEADGRTGGKEEAALGTSVKARGDKAANTAGESKDESKKDKRDKGDKGSKKKEGKKEKRAKKDKEEKKEKEGSRKRAAEETGERGPDTVQKAKKQKVKA